MICREYYPSDHVNKEKTQEIVQKELFKKETWWFKVEKLVSRVRRQVIRPLFKNRAKVEIKPKNPWRLPQKIYRALQFLVMSSGVVTGSLNSFLERHLEVNLKTSRLVLQVEGFEQISYVQWENLMKTLESLLPFALIHSYLDKYTDVLVFEINWAPF